MITPLTQDTFATFLAQKGTLVVDFYAEWCGPCKAIAPILEEISKENPTISFGKVNVDEVPELAGKYNVSSIPTLLVFKDGQVVNQVVGAVGKEGFKKVILG